MIQGECEKTAEFVVKDAVCNKQAVCLKQEFRFLRNERLKGRKLIQAVFKQGKSFSCKGAKLYWLKNQLDYNRICFTFSGGFGNAVKRNRSRRLSRESYRFIRSKLQTGYDLILLVYPETQVSLNIRAKQLEFLFSKAGIKK